MIEWQDAAILVATAPYSDTQWVVRVLTRHHGLCAGLVRTDSRSRRELDLGNHGQATWRARMAGQLGRLNLEVTGVPAAAALDDPGALLALQSSTALVAMAMPEAVPMPGLHDGLRIVHDHLPEAALWPYLLIRWELALLAALGFGLDLSRCAVTGAVPAAASNDPLAWVSPRTGRAVSLSAGEAWAARLLPLPGFLAGYGPQTAGAGAEAGRGVGRGAGGETEIVDGLRLTGYFLEHHLFASLNRPLPAARHSLALRLGVAATPLPAPSQS